MSELKRVLAISLGIQFSGVAAMSRRPRRSDPTRGLQSAHAGRSARRACRGPERPSLGGRCNQRCEAHRRWHAPRWPGVLRRGRNRSRSGRVPLKPLAGLVRCDPLVVRPRTDLDNASAEATARPPELGVRSLPRCFPRSLRQIDQPSPPPSYTEQPRPRLRHRRWVVGGRHARTPSHEPTAGRRRVDERHPGQRATELRKMAARVQEDVGDRVADLARRSKHVEVIAVGEDGPSVMEHSVHGSCEP